MNQKNITSRELLSAVGIGENQDRTRRESLPPEYRHLLISSVLECISAPNLKQFLNDQGVKVSTRIVLSWLAETREWLGLPPASPGKPSAQYQRAIQEWRAANGNPSWEEIDSGWVPAHHREQDYAAKQLSPSSQRTIEEFRRQADLLDRAENDDEVKRLLTQLLEAIGMHSHFPLLASWSYTLDIKPDGIPNEPLQENTLPGSPSSPDEGGNERGI